MSDLKVFRIAGEFMMGTRWQPFSKEFLAKDEKESVEFAYSILGSKHKVKRKFIRIEKIEEIKNVEEIKNPAIKERLSSEVKV